MLVGGKWVLAWLANGWYQPAHAGYAEQAMRGHDSIGWAMRRRGGAGCMERVVRRHGSIGHVERTDGTAHPRWLD